MLDVLPLAGEALSGGCCQGHMVREGLPCSHSVKLVGFCFSRVLQRTCKKGVGTIRLSSPRSSEGHTLGCTEGRIWGALWVYINDPLYHLSHLDSLLTPLNLTVTL